MRRTRGLYLPSGVSGGGGGGGGGGTGGRTDLPGFKLNFDDDFPTTVAEGSMFAVQGDHAKGLGAYTKWGAQTYLTTYGSQKGTGDYYGISNMSVVSGISGANGNCLKMRLYVDGSGKKVGANPYPNVSTPGSSSASSSQLYGRYEVRYIVTGTGAGWKTAWMIWPQTWAWDFETDWVEGSLSGRIGAFVHWPSATHNANQASGFSSSASYTSWHTSVCEWTPTGTKIFLDGALLGSTTASSGRSPIKPGFCMLQTENNLPGGSQPTGTANVYIDYYSQWAYVG